MGDGWAVHNETLLLISGTSCTAHSPLRELLNADNPSAEVPNGLSSPLKIFWLLKVNVSSTGRLGRALSKSCLISNFSKGASTADPSDAALTASSSDGRK